MSKTASYRLPYRYIGKFLIAMALGREREVGEDAASVLAAAGLPYRVEGQENVPTEGPFALIANHYERPGLKVFWGGMVLTAAVWSRIGRSPRWLMTSEWYGFRLGFIPVPVALLRWLFRRLADVYRLIIVPRATERAMGRAAALRAILQAAHEGSPIAFFPEGIGTGSLVRPPEAVGLLLLALAEKGVPTIPAALYEEDDRLVARIGRPFLLKAEDRHQGNSFAKARDEAMLAIGRLLPPHLWGEYAMDLKAALEQGGQFT